MLAHTVLEIALPQRKEDCSQVAVNWRIGLRLPACGVIGNRSAGRGAKRLVWNAVA